MNIKVNIWTIIVVALAVTLEILVIAKVFNDNRRLSDNFTALAKGTEYYRIGDSISASRTERILLDNAEMKSYFPEITAAIGQMNVKLRQLERYSAVNSTAKYEIASRLHDTIKIVRDRIVLDTVKLQYTRYKDRWIDFQQAVIADSAYTSIQTRDSIAIVQRWERPHKFWFLRWGRKRHIQTVTNANPNAKITYSIFVERQ
ncbi:MAG: hypothetical protein LBV41_01820 [Cytophagaceae bacterium]|jgi:hypothetical protein|nr:hypothetical protein [Cytophagaceae bacterium]